MLQFKIIYKILSNNIYYINYQKKINIFLFLFILVTFHWSSWWAFSHYFFFFFFLQGLLECPFNSCRSPVLLPDAPGNPFVEAAFIHSSAFFCIEKYNNNNCIHVMLDFAHSLTSFFIFLVFQILMLQVNWIRLMKEDKLNLKTRRSQNKA